MIPTFPKIQSFIKRYREIYHCLQTVNRLVHVGIKSQTVESDEKVHYDIFFHDLSRIVELVNCYLPLFIRRHCCTLSDDSYRPEALYLLRHWRCIDYVWTGERMKICRKLNSIANSYQKKNSFKKSSGRLYREELTLKEYIVQIMFCY